jgi:hypothetical protein
MSHYLPDLKNLSFKDQCLQLKDPNLKVNKTISKLKEIKFHLEKIKLLINSSQNLNWEQNKKSIEKFQCMNHPNTNNKDRLLTNKSQNHFLFSKWNSMMGQMFNTLKFMKGSNQMILLKILEENSIWVKMLKWDFSIKLDNKLLIEF